MDGIAASTFALSMDIQNWILVSDIHRDGWGLGARIGYSYNQPSYDFSLEARAAYFNRSPINSSRNQDILLAGGVFGGTWWPWIIGFGAEVNVFGQWYLSANGQGTPLISPAAYVKFRIPVGQSSAIAPGAGVMLNLSPSEEHRGYEVVPALLIKGLLNLSSNDVVNM